LRHEGHDLHRGKKPKGSRTNRIAILVKERTTGTGFPRRCAWRITIGEGVVSTTDLAAFITADAEFWASVDDVVKRA
jgi:hypothetical protein